jgi:indolepyruvate ferredoxin oxidoreductase
MVAAARSVSKMKAGKTKSVINTAEVPVAAFTRNNNMTFPAQETRDEFIAASTPKDVNFIDATTLAQTLFGDSIAANLFMVGYAFQKGYIPLSEASIIRATELNGVAVEFNKRAFQWGRLAASDMAKINTVITAPAQSENSQDLSLDQVIERHFNDLIRYQNTTYADHYKKAVENARTHASDRLGTDQEIGMLVAKYLYKVMAYKDEYEIGRLYSDPAFLEKLQAQFDGNYKLKFNLAPPLLSRKDKVTGHPKKITFGAWMLPIFKLLAKSKGLRGSMFDVFSYTQERKTERQLITDYNDLITKVVPQVTHENKAIVTELLSLPEHIRGYGHVKEESMIKTRDRWQELLQKV